MPNIYSFESEAKKGLFAFAGDESGSQLPQRFAPWREISVILPHHRLPHRINRELIEQTLSEVGFALWRIKKPASPLPEPAAS